MSLHTQKHAINSSDHEPGTIPATGEHNVVATNDAGTLVELTAEAENATPSEGGVLAKRASDGHLKVPTAGQEDDEALSKQQIESMIADGIWKAPVHSAVADHTDAGVGDGSTGGPALAVGDLVINTTDAKIYEVASIGGGTTGATVTWDSGTLPTTQEVRIEQLGDSEYVFDTDTSAWISRGSSSHARQHSMTSTTDHTAGTHTTFYGDGDGAVQELALGAANAPLLSGGTSSAPVFGALKIAPASVSAAGATPVDSDVSAWGENTFGIVVGTGGRVFFAAKNATDVYYVEATAI